MLMMIEYGLKVEAVEKNLCNLDILIAELFFLRGSEDACDTTSFGEDLHIIQTSIIQLRYLIYRLNNHPDIPPIRILSF